MKELTEDSYSSMNTFIIIVVSSIITGDVHSAIWKLHELFLNIYKGFFRHAATGMLPYTYNGRHDNNDDDNDDDD